MLLVQFVIIPDYQRGYACKELVNLHTEGYHYTSMFSMKVLGHKNVNVNVMLMLNLMMKII